MVLLPKGILPPEVSLLLFEGVTFARVMPAHKTQRSPFAIIWFCDSKNVSHILPDYNNEVQMGDYIHDNTIYNTQGKATVTCGYSGPDSVTTVPLETFLDAGLMKGTKVGTTPDDATVLAWAAKLLGMPTDDF